MLTIGIDWDDVLCDLNARAVELANKEYEFNPPLVLEEIDTWENTGRASVIKKYYKEQRLYDAQYVTNEAKKFMSMLCKQADVYICTAVAPDFMGTRVKQIKNAFPDFPEGKFLPQLLQSFNFHLVSPDKFLYISHKLMVIQFPDHASLSIHLDGYKNTKYIKYQ